MSGLVYFLSDGDLIKVGYAQSVDLRIRDLQTGNGRKIVHVCSAPATLKQERKLHTLFPDRAEGEWFHPSTKLLRLIRIIVATPHCRRADIIPEFIRHERDKAVRRAAVEASRHARLISRLRAEMREFISEIVADHGATSIAHAIGFTDGAIRWWKSGRAMPSALAVARLGVYFPDRIMDMHRPLGAPTLIARAERLGIAA